MTQYFPREFRELGFVTRWGIARTIQRQSVAEHMFFVAHYARRTLDLLGYNEQEYPEVYLNVIKWAMDHDKPEGGTGDIQGPAKRHMLDETRAAIFENNYTHEIYGHNAACSDDFVRRVVKFADILDEAMFVATDIQLGNKSLGDFKLIYFYASNMPVSQMALDRLKLAWTAMVDAGDFNIEYTWDYAERTWREEVYGAILHAQCGLSRIPQNP